MLANGVDIRSSTNETFESFRLKLSPVAFAPWLQNASIAGVFQSVEREANGAAKNVSVYAFVSQ